MVHWHAKELVSSKARYLSPIGISRENKKVKFRRVILWVDMEKCLKKEVPLFLKNAVYEMANFQRWIWNSDNPAPLIKKMIKQRELK